MANLFDKPDEEELDLDYGEDPTLDPEYEPTAEYDRGSRAPLPSAHNPVDWAPIREGLHRHRISKGIGEDGKKVARKRVESEDSPITVLEAAHIVEPTAFPQAPKGIAKRAAARGFEVQGVYSRAHYAATLYQDDSKTKEGDEEARHFRGDVRWPAEDRQHFTLHGRWYVQGKLIAAFKLYYEARPDEATKAGYAWKYAGAHHRDYVIGRQWAGTATDFGDWFDVIVPPEKPKAPRKTLEEKRAAKVAAPMETGEWIG